MNTNGQDNHMEQPKAPNRPRIAHVNFCPSMGVYKKIAGQAQASKEAHLDIDFFILVPGKGQIETQFSLFLKMLPTVT